MKRITIVVLVAFAITASADILIIRLSKPAGKLQMTLQGRPVSTEAIKTNLMRIAQFGTNFQVFVSIGTNVSASAVVDLLAVVKSTGLSKVNLLVPGEKDGKKGAHEFPITLDDRPIASCLGPHTNYFLSAEDMNALEEVPTETEQGN